MVSRFHADHDFSRFMPALAESMYWPCLAEDDKEVIVAFPKAPLGFRLAHKQSPLKAELCMASVSFFKVFVPRKHRLRTSMRRVL